MSEWADYFSKQLKLMSKYLIMKCRNKVVYIYIVLKSLKTSSLRDLLTGILLSKM